MTSQGSDTVISIFKCNSSNTIKSLRLLKKAQFSYALEIFVSISCGNKMWKQNGGQCDWAYGEVNELGSRVIPGILLPGFSYNQHAVLTQCFSNSQAVCYIFFKSSQLLFRNLFGIFWITKC